MKYEEGEAVEVRTASGKFTADITDVRGINRNGLETYKVDMPEKYHGGELSLRTKMVHIGNDIDYIIGRA